MNRPESRTCVRPGIGSIGFLLIPGYALMTYAAAIEPLRAANQLAGKKLYRWWNAAPADKPAHRLERRRGAARFQVRRRRRHST